GVDVTGLDQEDVITSGLESLNIGTAGRFKSADDNGAALEPLVTSSERASLMPAARFQLLSDPGELQNDFTPTGEQYVLAARLSGRLETAFPDGPPADDAADGGADEAETGDASASPAAAEAGEGEAAAEDSAGNDSAGGEDGGTAQSALAAKQ